MRRQLTVAANQWEPSLQPYVHPGLAKQVTTTSRFSALEITERTDGSVRMHGMSAVSVEGQPGPPAVAWPDDATASESPWEAAARREPDWGTLCWYFSFK